MPLNRCVACLAPERKRVRQAWLACRAGGHRPGSRPFDPVLVVFRERQGDGSWKVVLDIFNSDMPAGVTAP